MSTDSTDQDRERRWFVSRTARAHRLKPDGKTARCGWQPFEQWYEIDPDGYVFICGLCRRMP